MRTSQAITGWLLERLGLDAALSGDLLEECAQGRSAIWYWRQVLIAVCTGILGAIWEHKLLALRAVATGVAAEFLLNKLWWFFPHLDLFSTEWWVLGSLFMLVLQGVTGWIIARTHRTHPIPMVTVFLVCLMVLWMFFFRRSYLALYLDCVLLANVGILAGGFWGARTGNLAH